LPLTDPLESAFNGEMEDRNFSELSPEECRAMLQSVSVGRVGLSVNAQFTAIPLRQVSGRLYVATTDP